MKTICFDLDGTLTDPKVGITESIRHALTEVTGDAPDADELTWCIGPPLLTSMETLLGDKDKAALALAKYRERFGDVGLFENELYPGISQTLSGLVDRGYRLFVATSKPTVYAKQIIEHFELACYFDEVYGSELDGTRSDKSHLLAHLLDKTGTMASKATMIGDRLHDIKGARNNAMRSIGVLYGYGSEAELIDAGADLLCKTPDNLVDTICRG